MHSTRYGGLVTLALQLALFLAVACGRQQVPFGVAEGLFGRDSLSTESFEVYPGAETFIVFRAEEVMDSYRADEVSRSFLLYVAVVGP